MTTGGTFLWQGLPITFRAGETIAAALAGANVHGFGKDAAGAETRYFCGIGACQSCLVRLNGKATEACLEPAIEGAAVSSLEGSHG